MPRRNAKESNESSENGRIDEMEGGINDGTMRKEQLNRPDSQLMTGHRRLVEELLDQQYYDPTGEKILQYFNKMGKLYSGWALDGCLKSNEFSLIHLINLASPSTAELSPGDAG
jgi:hypothetical protein